MDKGGVPNSEEQDCARSVAFDRSYLQYTLVGLGSGSEMMQPVAIVTKGDNAIWTLLSTDGRALPCIPDLFTRNKSMSGEEV